MSEYKAETVVAVVAAVALASVLAFLALNYFPPGTRGLTATTTTFTTTSATTSYVTTSVTTTFTTTTTKLESKSTTTTSTSTSGLTPPSSSIGKFGTMTDLDGARKMVVNLKIKLPEPSTLPNGYSLQAVLVEPRGPDTRETYSGRIFRPEAIHLYYSDKPINGSMVAGEHPEWVIISEGYSLGSNSTEPYGQDNPQTGYKVGWFYGYPGYTRGSLLLVYQFEENMSYQIYAPLLSQEQILAIMKPLLLE